MPGTVVLVVQPFVVVAGIGLLIWSLGYSALVGVGVSLTSTKAHRRIIDASLQILVGFTPLVGTSR